MLFAWSNPEAPAPLGRWRWIEVAVTFAALVVGTDLIFARWGMLTFAVFPLAGWIALPRPGHRYRVITSQNLAALDTPSDKKGRLEGTLKIRDAQQFWAKSKFLILVEQ